MKILVADKIAEAGVALLREQGFEVVVAPGSSPEKVLELVRDVDAIVVRSATQITREVIQAAPVLKAVGRAGVGVDNIDVDAATERGVIVMNTPGGNTIATCELTFTHLLCTARPIAQADASMKGGKWEKKKFEGTELHNKTLGVLGLGRIGSQVARRALAFDMRVLAYDPFLTRERALALGVEKVELDELLPQADFITIHMPRTEATDHMINAESIARMKDGVRIVNVARGGIIDEPALAAALKSGKVAAAGLDVFQEEPLSMDSPLRGLPNLVMTPHLGASTTEAQEASASKSPRPLPASSRAAWCATRSTCPRSIPRRSRSCGPTSAWASCWAPCSSRWPHATWCACPSTTGARSRRWIPCR
jgi:D-3-phosphoglycerate dehydrogenase